jgi:SPP1 gp7 family putative phage head morphogenesis protein
MATRNLRTLHHRIQGKLEKLQRSGLNATQAQYRVALEDIRDELRKLFDKYARDGVLTYAEMTKYNRLNNLERQLSEILRPVLRRNAATIDRLSAASYEASYYQYGWSIAQAAGVDLRWGLLRTETVREAVRNPLRELAKRNLSNRTLRQVRTAVTQGLIRGSSYTRMSRDMRQVLNVSMSDAQRIVRTESARATTLGTQRAYDEAEDAGVETRRVWDATLDLRTRPAHARIDGTAATNRGSEADPDYQWYLAGEWVRGPAQHSNPAQSINCRCAIRPEIVGFEPRVRRSRDDGIRDYETFAKWAERKGVKKNKYGQQYSFDQ